MPPRQKKWQIAPPITPEADSALHGYPPILRQILFNRGYAIPESARHFLEAQTPPGTRPLSMMGMSEAVNRTQYAIRNQESIIVYGDYDADGVTATALLASALKAMGAKVEGYIPNRFEEGYGLNTDALDTLREAGARLVITVDCGIRSIAEAEHARKIGLDLIITDHHHPGDSLPEARAVINPKQAGDDYPEKDLAGVGLAYKLMCALGEAAEEGFQPESALDLVALGTVADMAPLTGENRALVKAGLQRLRHPARHGTRALIGAAMIEPSKINAGHIGYLLGPRLNAAGRLDTALDALQLLMTDDALMAGRLAQKLQIQNRERQELTRWTQEQAEMLALMEDPDPLLLIAVSPEFNPGVVGLAASRLLDTYYRPAIVAARGEEFTRASCRSIAEFHITAALDQCADLMEHHGGHAAAAGFTIRNDRFPLLIERLKAIAAAELYGKDLQPALQADLELPLADMKPVILEYQEWLEPTGYGNKNALFVSRNLRASSKRLVGAGKHLKLSVTDGRITYDAIAFNQGHWYEKLPPYLDLLYAFETNEYNGRVSLQLNVRDLRPSQG